MTFGPTRLPDQLPPIKLRAALVKRRQMQTFADDAVPPEVAILDRILGVAYTQLVAAAAKLRIADHVADAPRTVDELAAITGADRGALERALRALVGIGVFQRGDDGRIAQNRVSYALRSDHPSRSREYAMLWAGPALGAAWGDFGETVRSGAAAFERVHGVAPSAWMDAHPADRDVHDEAVAGRHAFDAPGIARGYPFDAGLRVCEVGGGRGIVLSEILVAKTYLHGVFVERATVLDSARRLFQERGVAERVDLVAGDALSGLPTNCQTYLLTGVLSACDDARALRILQACRAAMRRGHRVVVIDALLDKGNPYDYIDDVQRLVMTGGRQRTQAELARLLARAGFEKNRVLDLVTTGAMEGIAQ